METAFLLLTLACGQTTATADTAPTAVQQPEAPPGPSSKTLAAFEEPSIRELASDPKAEVYRVIWVRTFHKPVCVRVTFQEPPEPGLDGTATVITKVLSGKGGYEWGELERNDTTELDFSPVSYMEDMLERADYWDLPADDPGEGEEIRLDGATWTLEAIKDGKYHRVTRWSPDCDDWFRKTALDIIGLSSFKPYYHEVY